MGRNLDLAGFGKKICSPIHKELTKLAEMALDLSAEFRQFGTNKKSTELSRKIVAENSAKKNLSILSEFVIFV